MVFWFYGHKVNVEPVRNFNVYEYTDMVPAIGVLSVSILRFLNNQHEGGAYAYTFWNR